MSFPRKSRLRPLVPSGDMLRKQGLVLLTICNIFSRISSEHIMYTNGWIPMTHNDIYDQIRRETSRPPTYITLKPSIDSDDSFMFEQRNFVTEKYVNDGTENLISSKKHSSNSNKHVDEIEKIDPITLNSKENTRNAKTVKYFDLIKDFNHIFDSSKLEPKKIRDRKEENTTYEDIANAETMNTYEVTEYYEKLWDTDDKETTQVVGYQYSPPPGNINNLTSTFFKILSQYNINNDDKLKNYDLSLQHKDRNPSTLAYQVPLPYRYNSLNHLPADPLLAVFLSNYGFYLPSLYGIKSNYNNLYGYLASNNIHNNKPFGPYKIFSDTDSSN